MVGIVAGFACILILVLFWSNQKINIKWKIILTVIVVASKLILPELWSVIVSALALISMFLMLRWHGSKIR